MILTKIMTAMFLDQVNGGLLQQKKKSIKRVTLRRKNLLRRKESLSEEEGN